MDEETKIFYDKLKKQLYQHLQPFVGKPNTETIRKEISDLLCEKYSNLDKFEDLIEIKNTTSDDDVKENKMVLRKPKGDCVYAKFDDVLNGCLYVRAFNKCPEYCTSYENELDRFVNELDKEVTSYMITESLVNEIKNEG